MGMSWKDLKNGWQCLTFGSTSRLTIKDEKCNN